MRKKGKKAFKVTKNKAKIGPKYGSVRVKCVGVCERCKKCTFCELAT